MVEYNLVKMFNMLFEHLFVCQSLLKEWRRPLTGGLLEAFKESLGGEVFTPPSPCVRSKMRPLEPLLLDFPLPGETMITPQ